MSDNCAAVLVVLIMSAMIPAMMLIQVLSDHLEKRK